MLPSRQVHSYERIELVMIIGLKVPDYPGGFLARGYCIGNISQFMISSCWPSLKDAHE